MDECGYCGTPLPPPKPTGRPRRYCCDNHKAYACLLRKAEGDAMDPDPVALPDLTIEAYGTVTPPPEHTPREGGEDDPS